MTMTLGSTPALFRAFADPTRLRILNLLLQGEVCVCDLCAVLGETQAKVSRHLAYLRRAELVVFRTRGKWKYYAVARHAKGIERKLLDCIRSCLSQMDELADDLERLRTTDSAGCGG